MPGYSPGMTVFKGNPALASSSADLAETWGATVNRVDVIGLATRAGRLLQAPPGAACSFESAYTLLFVAG